MNWKVIDARKICRIVSLDVPSGVDSNTGRNEGGLSPSVTVTLAWPKEDFFKFEGRSLGDLYLVDIGVPKQLSINGLKIIGNAITEGSVIKIELGRENDTRNFKNNSTKNNIVW